MEEETLGQIETDSPKAEPKASGGLVDEIDASVEEAMAEFSSSKKPAGEEEESAVAVDEDLEDTEAPLEEGGRPESEAPPISDPDIERAVKAGLSVSEAKSFQSKSLLLSMCDRLEGMSSQDGVGKISAKTTQDGEDADPVASIPDLDPDEYDEQIVSGFKAMKEIIRAQQDTIKGMRTQAVGDWVGDQLEGMKDLTGGDSTKETAVRLKFDMLTAGYNATGHDIPKQEVFSEAAKLVLGDEMKSARAEANRDAAKRRSGQRINRPSSNRVKPRADVFEDTAAEIDRKYFS